MLLLKWQLVAHLEEVTALNGVTYTVSISAISQCDHIWAKITINTEPCHQIYNHQCYKTRKQSSHTDMHNHAGSKFHNPETLTFWPQGQCMLRSCHSVHVYQPQVVFVLQRGHTQTHTRTQEVTDATNHPTHSLVTAGVGKLSVVGWLVGWSLAALLTQFRSYRAFKVKTIGQFFTTYQNLPGRCLVCSHMVVTWLIYQTLTGLA